MISDSDSKVILKLFSPFCVYSYLSGEMGSLRCSWAIQIIVAMAILLLIEAFSGMKKGCGFLEGY